MSSRFDGIGPESEKRFGRPLWDLTPDERATLYRERGIMPAGKPNLRLVRDTPASSDSPPLDI